MSLFFGQVPERLAKTKEARVLPLSAFKDVPFADDVTTIITADTGEDLAARGNLNGSIMKTVIAQRGAEIKVARTRNAVLRPFHLPPDVLRGGMEHRYPITNRKL